MALRVLCIGDIHIRVNAIPEGEQLTNKLLETVQKLKPDLVVVLGDNLDRHAEINVYPLCLAVEFFNKLRKLAPLYILIGNHDRPNNSDFLSEYHPFTALHNWENTVVVDKVKIMEKNGFKFVFIPYVPPGRFLEALNTVPNWRENATAIFAHQEFKGSKYKGLDSKDGDIWPLDYPLVITGHIHMNQWVQKNLYYPGTPIQISADEFEEKTISLLMFSKSDFKEERICLNLKRKVTVHLNVKDFYNYEPSPNTITRIILEGDSTEVNNAYKSNKAKELKKKDVKIVKTPTEYKRVKIENKNYLTYRERLLKAVKEKKLLELLKDILSKIFS